MAPMFKKITSEQEILSRLNQRKAEIKNLDKLPMLDKFYLSFLSKYDDIEITPDIDIFGYESALKENNYLDANHPDISKLLWIIGGTGQGDGWFMDKNTGCILFYDHDQGEYSNIEQFVNFDISFLEFLQMSLLYQDLENLLNRQETGTSEISNFKNVINSIRFNLYDLYPFNYFQQSV